MEEKQKQSKVDRETAELDFLRWIESLKIDTDQFDSDDDEGKSARISKERIVKAIMAGRFVVDEKDIAVLIGADVKGELSDIKFRQIYGGLFCAMDRHKDGHHVAKMQAALSAWTGLPDKTFAMMHPGDLKICQAALNLFLA